MNFYFWITTSSKLPVTNDFSMIIIVYKMNCSCMSVTNICYIISFIRWCTSCNVIFNIIFIALDSISWNFWNPCFWFNNCCIGSNPTLCFWILILPFTISNFTSYGIYWFRTSKINNLAKWFISNTIFMLFSIFIWICYIKFSNISICSVILFNSFWFNRNW